MKQTPKTYAGILLILMISLMLPGQVQASHDNNNSLLVDITRAEYTDLDFDNRSDDILTNFDIMTPSGEWDTSVTIIFCELILPSGYAFYFITIILGDYTKIEISLGWFNCAIEEGWYLIKVHAIALGPDAPDYGYGETLFDPPEDGNPGTPGVEILNQTIT